MEHVIFIQVSITRRSDIRNGARGGDRSVRSPAANYRLTGNGQGRSKLPPATLAGKACGVLVLCASGSFPEPGLEADQVHIGGQTIRLEGRNLRLAKTAAPKR